MASEQAYPVQIAGDDQAHLELIEQVPAFEIIIGDIVARAKSHVFNRVVDAEPLVVSVRLKLERGGNIRPSYDAQLWRVVQP